MDKKEALQRINKLLNKVHLSAQNEIKALLRLRSAGYESLSKRCLDLKESILKTSTASDSVKLGDELVGAHLMKLECEYAAIQGKSKRVLATGVFIIFAILCAIFYFFSTTIKNELTNMLGVEETFKYIVLGIGGALVYFVTEGFTKKELASQEEGLSFQRIISRIILAIIIPIVFIVVFSFEDGNMNPNTPALICFAAGYSSKLVVMFLNKIVEKGQQIIKAI